MTAIDNRMPTLVLNYVIAVAGNTVGSIHSVGFNFTTGDTIDADGSVLNIADFPALFDVIGTTYGGDGVTTFAVPDLGGRVIAGAGAGAGLTERDVGDVFGNDAINLSQDNLPTSIGGGGMAIDNTQETVTITYGIRVNGTFPSRSFDGSSDMLATIQAFVGDTVPTGYLPLEGQILEISSNTALFSLLGTTYGGDGRTTFALPDARGRVIVGEGRGPGLSDVRLGERDGSETITLTEAQLPSDLGGGSQAFDNEQPTLALNYIVALTGLFPSDSGAFTSSEPTLGEVILFAGNFPPRGFAFAHGQILSIASNSALFAIYGTQYGGDGETTFALPDLRGRSIIDEAPDINSGQLGGTFGQETTVITNANLDSLEGVAANDAFTISENGQLVAEDVTADNGNGADVEPINVMAVNGFSANVGTQITLSSGALLTVNTDGTFDYDANGAFEFVPEGETITDAFTYRVGASTATVTIIINGEDNDDTFDGVTLSGAINGGLGNNTISYESSGVGVTVSLADASVNTGDAAGDTYIKIQNILGTVLDDTLTGNDGNNIIIGGLGADSMAGGDGIDTLDYVGSLAGVTVDLGLNSGLGGDAEGDILSSFERVFGSNEGDNITGDANNNFLYGGDGDDTISGLLGRDVISGGAGADTLNGGDGFDTLDYRDSSEGVTLDIAAGTGMGGHAEGDVISEFERVFGSNFSDDITGTTSNDIIFGFDGDDTISGGLGDDFLRGGAGADDLIGGDDVDTVDYRGSADGVTVDIQAGTGLGGDAEGDMLSGIERVLGSANGDTITGNDQDNLLQGLDGDDVLNGGLGRDLIRGGDGADTITGGAGRDALFGGDGADVFIFEDIAQSVPGAMRDSIRDFISGSDSVDLSSIDAINGGGDDMFTFIGTNSFSNTAGELQALNLRGNTFIRGDIDGDGVADVEILLRGTLTLDTSDFVL